MIFSILWNKCKFYINSFIFISAITFILSSYFKEEKHHQHTFKLNNNNNSNDKANDQSSFAYASLLCDDVMIDAVKVLLYSFRESGSKWPFILLVLPQVKQTEELIKLGAKLVWIDPLEYPFKINAEKAAINKMCRYSKLHIWRMIEYKKIIFVDVDCLVVQNLDGAFKWPEFSAVRDAGDTFNTGLFVMQPSLDTYHRMKGQYMQAPSYNQGDQGFLNWFFRDTNKLALPVTYNTVCKHKSHAMWPILKKNTKMIHYTSETKPWNFFSGAHKYWRQNFDIGMFYLWVKAYRNVAKKLKIDVFDPNKPMWLNVNRVPEICEKSFSTLYENVTRIDTRISDKISILITNWKSLEGLMAAIEYYQSPVLSHLVQKIYVSWNPSNGPIPTILSNKAKSFGSVKSVDSLVTSSTISPPPLEILSRRYESWNNIWSPIPNIGTKAILTANDEHFPDAEKIEIALEAWKDSQYGLVGFFARYHGRQRFIDVDLIDPDDPSSFPFGFNSTGINNPLNPGTNIAKQQGISSLSASLVDEHWSWSYNLTSIRRPKPYSLLSSQLMLLSHDYFFIYSCLLPEKIHRFVDEQPEDSSDFVMNLLAAGLSGIKPILVKHEFLTDPEQSKYSEGWAVLRANILKELLKIFTGGTRDTLMYNAISIGQFNKIPFKKRSAKQWNHV